MKVLELEGAELDYWSIKATKSWEWAHRLFPTMTLDPTFNGVRIIERMDGKKICILTPSNPMRQDPQEFSPSTDWAHGGPIIEKEGVCIEELAAGWCASMQDGKHDYYEDESPLVVAMKSVIESRFGKDVPRIGA